jgi:hypothetical protein
MKKSVFEAAKKVGKAFEELRVAIEKEYKGKTIIDDAFPCTIYSVVVSTVESEGLFEWENAIDVIFLPEKEEDDNAIKIVPLKELHTLRFAV